ncbi:MAG: site-specific integrase [Alphaproteobacteria bacterium]
MGDVYQLQATKTPYLFQRGQKFYFRAMLPKRQGCPRRISLCISLKTTDGRAAKVIVAKIQIAMAQLLHVDLQLSNPDVVKALKRIAREHFADTLAERNMWLEVFDTEQLAEDVAETVESLTAKREKLRQKTPPDTQQRSYLKRLILTKLVDSERELENYLDRLFTQAEIEAARIYLAKAKGDYAEAKINDAVFQGIDTDIIHPMPETLSNGEIHLPRYVLPPDTQPTIAPPAKAHDTSETLEEAMKAYATEKRNKGKNIKTVLDIESCFTLFREMFPNIKQVNQFTNKHLMEFSSNLGQVPKNYTKLKQLAGKPMAEILEAGKKLPTFSPANQDKYNVNLRSFKKWLMTSERTASQVLPTFEAMDKAKSNEKRESYKADDLVKFFNTPQYTGHQPDGIYQYRYKKGDTITMDALYWVPLISLYTGMRSGEICQMAVGDIKQANDIWYFDVNDDEGGIEGKSIKSASSKRVIPIHPKLIELGITRFVSDMTKQGRKRIFEEIERGWDGTYSQNFTRLFRTYLEGIELKRRKLVFHSFRHTFTSTCRRECGIPMDTVQALLGHSTAGSVTEGYTDDISLEKLHEAICKLTYPEAVTKHLKPYKKS